MRTPPMPKGRKAKNVAMSQPEPMDRPEPMAQPEPMDKLEPTRNEEQAPEPSRDRLVMELAPGTDYVYRDMFNVFATQEDVIIEFGNMRREIQGRAVIGNRIALTPKSAAKLQKVLQQTLGDVKRKVKENRGK